LKRRSRGTCRSLRRSIRKQLAEHRQSARGFGLRGFVLNQVPILDQDSIDDTDEIRNDPVLRLAAHSVGDIPRG
jgi:hypothetical protein